MADSEQSPGAPPLKVDALEAELEGKAPPPVPPQTQLEAAGSARPGFWSRITFAFAYPTFRKVLSLRTKVSLADMPVCPPSDAAALQSARMKALIRSKGGVLAAYLHFIKPLFMCGIGLSFCALACMFAGVYANRQVVEALSRSHAAASTGEEASDAAGFDAGHAYSWALFAGLIGLVFSNLTQNSIMCGKTAARRAYAAFCSLIFEKPSIITAGALASLQEGQVLNMMSTDCLSVTNVTMFLQWVSFSVAMIITSSILIVLELGAIALPAIALLIVCSFVNKRIGDKNKILMGQKNKASDERNVKLNETLQGMRTVKLYAWENVVTSRIQPIRRKEEEKLKDLAWWNAVNSFIMMSTPRVAVCATLLLYVEIHGPIGAARAFYVANLFDYLNFGVIILPMITVMWSLLRSNLERIEKLLVIPEDYVTPQPQGSNGQILVQNADFTWATVEDEQKQKESTTEPKTKQKEKGQTIEPTLRNICMAIKPGSMIAVVGKVASGKTTLAHGLLSLVRAKSGTVAIGGSTALVAQQPFIMNDTIRNNIVFHDDFDEQRYLDTIYATCLRSDMDVFVDGDNTEVGEKGVTMSGGQKQRVALARAAYSQADVLVFDDPLSAMDAHVGMTVFRRLFQRMLADKTRVFCTNQLQYCEYCDYILVLQDGKIAEEGTFAELSSQRDGVFASMIVHQVGTEGAKQSDSQHASDEADTAERSKGRCQEDQTNDESTEQEDGTTAESTSPPLLQRQASDGKAVSTKLSDLSDPQKRGKSLMREEQKTQARPSPLYMAKMARVVDAFGLVCLAAFLFVASPTIEWLQNYFLSEWTKGGTKPGLSGDAAAYLCTSFSYAMIIAIAGPTYQYFFLKCSTKLHMLMLDAVQNQSMKWFDTTPVGRILNVFSSDMMDLDVTLPNVFRHWQFTVVIVVVALIPTLVLVPTTIPLILCLLLICAFAYRYYGDVNIEIGRLYMMSIGPILSAFSGYLQGLDTIRAFGRMEAFQHQFDKAISGFMDVSHVQVCTDCMSQFFVGGPACCALFMLPLALLLVYTREQPGIAGLLLMYGASCSMRLPGALFSTVEVEKRMVSAQRVVEYIEMEVESALKSPPHKTSHEMDNWSPCEGALELHDVQMRYAPDLPLVLDGVSLKIEAGTKVGVVGRTGAGKSSLVLAVFRMMELDAGKITIDDVDVTTMPARTLRGALGMIPQDTFVWSGTVRENLDVTGQKTDAEIWAALEQVSLKQNVEELDGQLEHEIHEKGSNLSAGTVQLICLARVLLKQPKVIFMDE
eukprot:g3049.t1